MKLDNSNISTGNIQYLWWCNFENWLKIYCQMFKQKQAFQKKYLYKTEATYFYFPMKEGRTIK